MQLLKIDKLYKEKCEEVNRLVAELQKYKQAADKIPTEKKMPDWIPCSERLPEKEIDVLVSFADGDCVIAWCTMMSDDCIHWVNSSTCGEIVSEIMGWMPLPEPYRESEDASGKISFDTAIEVLIKGMSRAGLSSEELDNIKGRIPGETLEEYLVNWTVEECREAMEKQTAKRPDYEGDGYADGQLIYDTWICPCCGKYYEVDYDNYDFCPNCGQKLDWSDKD